jgi:nicotinate-nucleotide adenylyltransferase
MKRKQSRIGIYAGTFDPVHAGHITFAIQAMQAAELDRIYFLPERRPRNKQSVEHFAHRVAMLQRALRPHRQFGVLEFVDICFSVERTLPKLQHQFTDSQLVFLLGSDAVRHLPDWPHVERLLSTSELVIGVRANDDIHSTERAITNWSSQPRGATIFMSYAPDVSSGSVREALRRRQVVRGMLQSVARYSDRHWLYISLS